jgi:ribonuclease H-related protein
MAKKFYGIKKGFDFTKNEEVRNIILDNWTECLKYVKGAKGAVYKSFESLEEVQNYLKDENKILKKGIDNYPLDIPHAYVDGSFNSSTGKYGYGLVIVHDEIIMHIENGGAKDDSEKALRQISGELNAAIRAVEYAAAQKYKDIVIFHDYEGICHHATGAWERRDKSSQEYFNRINFLKNTNNINIIFVKVDSHTNDFFNEIADEQAKYGAGLSLNNVVDKLIKKTKVKVFNNEVKDKLKLIVSGNYNENITVFNHDNTKEEIAIEIENEYIDEVITKILNSSNEAEVNHYIANLDNETKNDIIIQLWQRVCR